MKKLEKTGTMRLIAVNSSFVVHHQEQQSIIEEIDFFNVQRPRKSIFLPQRKTAMKEIFFTEIFKPINISLSKKRALVDDQESADDHQIFKKRKFITDDNLKIIGVNMFITGTNDDTNEMIIDEDYPKSQPFSANLKKERCSRMKNPRNNSCFAQEHENPNAIHPWILRHIQLNGGSKPEFLFEKKLEKSDVNVGLGRLFITQSEKLLEALTQEERRSVFDEESKSGIRVYTFDGEGRAYELFLKRWPSLKVLVLNHQWRRFFCANRMENGDSVQGWGYRLNSEFRLVINFVKKRDLSMEWI